MDALSLATQSLRYLGTLRLRSLMFSFTLLSQEVPTLFQSTSTVCEGCSNLCRPSHAQLGKNSISLVVRVTHFRTPREVHCDSRNVWANINLQSSSIWKRLKMGMR